MSKVDEVSFAVWVPYVFEVEPWPPRRPEGLPSVPEGCTNVAAWVGSLAVHDRRRLALYGTDPEVLTAVLDAADAGDRVVRADVASNPAVPTQRLGAMLEAAFATIRARNDVDGGVDTALFRSLTANPSTPRTVTLTLVDEVAAAPRTFNRWVEQTLLKSPPYTTEEMLRVLEVCAPWGCQFLMRNPVLTAPVADELVARMGVSNARELALWWEDMPASMFATLFGVWSPDPVGLVDHLNALDVTGVDNYLTWVFSHKNVPPGWLADAAVHQSRQVRVLAAAHPSTPPAMLEMLACDHEMFAECRPAAFEVLVNPATDPHWWGPVSMCEVEVAARHRRFDMGKVPDGLWAIPAQMLEAARLLAPAAQMSLAEFVEVMMSLGPVATVSS